MEIDVRSDVSEFMGAFSTQGVSIARTASTLPDRVVSNRDIGELLIADVLIDDEAAADIVSKTRERSELIERKTGLRARRFFAPDQSPVDVGVELMERLIPEDAWATLDALIVSSSSTQGFPGLSQQVLAAMSNDRRERHENPWLSPRRVFSH
jgi:3-oxoacyl-[acyl-carrier-protein] synthase III